MKQVIRQLVERVGVRGALLMTDDGVVVAAELKDGLDSMSVAALASASVRRLQHDCGGLELGSIRRITLTAALGRLVFVPFEGMVLTIVTEPNLDLDLTLLEIAGPARRILQLSRLDGQE
jgi:predicted regulator of Ras-like GTPase activity (Roadblock/LC7/MglB family)